MQDCAFLVKCYYECYSNEQRVLQKYRTIRRIRQGPMTPLGLRKMMAKFEATGLLSVTPVRGMKLVSVETEEAVALAVEEATMESTHGTCSVSALTRRADLPLIPLHSPKVIVWCGMTASVGLFFFEEKPTAGHMTSTVTAAFMLRRFVIPELQQRGILDTMIFMQDGTPPHIGTCFK
ncbi:hypothetical protein AVEN_191091-1 [Araneus ventricosus]|uniref:DUF4817 domain-containing protein n=1 Tax=Araneus ventricosus TaxID=182803 RepID=A0A4Y2AX49_ARAVE|nr:hypothetical protein AVEN_191091-1 [Araneus ventricosus]